jgi:hypothetical protein
MVKQVLHSRESDWHIVSRTLALELPHKADPEDQTDSIFIKSPASGISKKCGFIEILLGGCLGSIV